MNLVDLQMFALAGVFGGVVCFAGGSLGIVGVGLGFIVLFGSTSSEATVRRCK